jgi:hypothetical protein
LPKRAYYFAKIVLQKKKKKKKKKPPKGFEQWAKKILGFAQLACVKSKTKMCAFSYFIISYYFTTIFLLDY